MKFAVILCVLEMSERLYPWSLGNMAAYTKPVNILTWEGECSWFKPRQRTVGKWGVVRAEEMILPHRKSSKIGYPIPSVQPWDQPRLRYSYRCIQITLCFEQITFVYLWTYVYIYIYIISTHYKWTIIVKGWWTWGRPKGCMRGVRERKMKGKKWYNYIISLKSKTFLQKMQDWVLTSTCS